MSNQLMKNWWWYDVVIVGGGGGGVKNIYININRNCNGIIIIIITLWEVILSFNGTIEPTCKKNEFHVKLQCFNKVYAYANTITHHLEGRFVFVLEKFLSEHTPIKFQPY